MPNVIHLADAIDRITPEPARLPFSFDITQPDANGNVLIDACVPVEIAAAILQLIIGAGSSDEVA